MKAEATVAGRAGRWAVYPAPISVSGVSRDYAIVAHACAPHWGWINVRAARDSPGADASQIRTSWARWTDLHQRVARDTAKWMIGRDLRCLASGCLASGLRAPVRPF